MSAATKLISTDLLASFSPLDQLSPAALNTLADCAQVETVKADTLLHDGTADDQQYLFLISGAVALYSNGRLKGVVRANSLQAKRPLNTLPIENLTIKSSTDAAIMRIAYGERDQPASVAGNTATPTPDADKQDNAQWMKRFLKSQAFLKLPAGNIQQLIASLEEIRIPAGKHVIEQGAPASYYYILKDGRCRVTRRITREENLVSLATLQAGDGFGEDALVSHCQRNATVTAIDDCHLMRLPKSLFIDLLVKPVLQPVSHKEAMAIRKAGGVLLDVRPANKFRKSGIKGSVNVPLSTIRQNVARLDRQSIYVTFCGDGNQSAAACFLLNQQGLKARWLEGGTKHLVEKSGHSAIPVLTQAENTRPAKLRKVTPKRKKPASAGSVAQTMPSATPVAPPAKQSTDAEKEIAAALQRANLAENARKAADAEIAKLKSELAALSQQIPQAPLTTATNADAGSETKAKAPRNTTIECIEVERDDMQLWTRIPDPVIHDDDEVKNDASNTGQPAAVAPERSADPVNLGWVSDSYLWENVLGYRSDAAIDALLDAHAGGAEQQSSATTTKDAPANTAAPATSQHAAAQPSTPPVSAGAKSRKAASPPFTFAAAGTSAPRRNKRTLVRFFVVLVLANAVGLTWYFKPELADKALQWSKTTAAKHFPQAYRSLSGYLPFLEGNEASARKLSAPSRLSNMTMPAQRARVTPPRQAMQRPARAVVKQPVKPKRNTVAPAPQPVVSKPAPPVASANVAEPAALAPDATQSMPPLNTPVADPATTIAAPSPDADPAATGDALAPFSGDNGLLPADSDDAAAPASTSLF